MTIPESTVWKADGVTEYRMDVFADTRGLEVFDQEVVGNEWRVLAPEGVVFVRAALPDRDDLYEGFSMWGGWNRVNRLDDNIRFTKTLWEGPANKFGMLGSYWFTVEENATLGARNFDIYNVRFYGMTENIMLRSPVENKQFVIVAP